MPLKISAWRGLLWSAALTIALAIAGCEGEAEKPTQLNWLTDLPKALAQAKTEHKLVLLDFTGSDWCPPCRKLHNHVFASAAFKTYSDKNLVLVLVDFPRNKPQSDELKKSNEALKQQFKVQGYPTVILLDADGNILKQDVGYGGAAPADFISGLEKASPKN